MFLHQIVHTSPVLGKVIVSDGSKASIGRWPRRSAAIWSKIEEGSLLVAVQQLHPSNSSSLPQLRTHCLNWAVVGSSWSFSVIARNNLFAWLKSIFVKVTIEKVLLWKDGARGFLLRNEMGVSVFSSMLVKSTELCEKIACKMWFD